VTFLPEVTLNRMANSEAGTPYSSIYKSISIPSDLNQGEMSKRYSGITAKHYMYQNDPLRWSERYSRGFPSRTVKITQSDGQNDPFFYKKNIFKFFIQNLDEAICRVYIHYMVIALYLYNAIK
jgi:hypothetical protein